MILQHTEERSLIERALRAEGVPQSPARVQAEWLVEADLRGHASHGIQRLPTIVERVRRGLTDPRAEPTVNWPRRAVARVDGRRGLGPWVGTQAIDAISARARDTGIALATQSNTNHLGMLAPYVERAVERDRVIAIAFTTSEALVHPWRGTRAMLGTNPLAIGIPADPPVVVDMATSAVSMGRVLSHRHRNEPLEPGWAIDAAGHSTLEPDRAHAISPFGGPKGYALGLAIELLVGALTESALGEQVAGTLDTNNPCNKGDVFVAINPHVIGFDNATALAEYIDAIRNSPARDDSEAVAIPGDGARHRRTQSLIDGIEIPDSVWEQIHATCPALELAV